MQVQASQQHIRMATRKVRLVANLIRGLDVEDARTTLLFTRKAITPVISKILQSAVANAVNNNKLDKKKLFVKEILVNQGPTMKRVMPRSQGRAYRILKRTSHVTIVLDERISSTTETSEKISAKKPRASRAVSSKGKGK